MFFGVGSATYFLVCVVYIFVFEAARTALTQIITQGVFLATTLFFKVSVQYRTVQGCVMVVLEGWTCETTGWTERYCPHRHICPHYPHYPHLQFNVRRRSCSVCRRATTTPRTFPSLAPSSSLTCHFPTSSHPLPSLSTWLQSLLGTSIR